VGPFDIPAPGYVYIYVNDNSNSPSWVHFDDLKITQVHSPFVSGADYYPFGLTMSDREILTEPYRFGYQGQFAEEDTETGWNAFDLRMYDARFGRWLSPDPYGQFASPYLAMGNNPVSGTDPDGGLCCGRIASSIAARAHIKVIKGVTVSATRTGLRSAATGVLNGLATTAMNRSMGGFSVNNSSVLNGGAAVEGVDQGHDVAPRERVDGFQVKWEKSNSNARRYKLVSERIEERLANALPNPWIDAASVGVGAFDIGTSITLAEIAKKPFWKGAINGTKIFSKSLNYVGLALTALEAYDDWSVNGTLTAHTAVDVMQTLAFTGVGAAGVAAGSVPLMVGAAVGGFAYGVMSAAGLDYYIDEVWDNHGRPLQQKLIKKIHRFK